MIAVKVDLRIGTCIQMRKVCRSSMWLCALHSQDMHHLCAASHAIYPKRCWEVFMFESFKCMGSVLKRLKSVYCCPMKGWNGMDFYPGYIWMACCGRHKNRAVSSSKRTRLGIVTLFLTLPGHTKLCAAITALHSLPKERESRKSELPAIQQRTHIFTSCVSCKCCYKAFFNVAQHSATHPCSIPASSSQWTPCTFFHVHICTVLSSLPPSVIVGLHLPHWLSGLFHPGTFRTWCLRRCIPLFPRRCSFTNAHIQKIMLIRVCIREI